MIPYVVDEIEMCAVASAEYGESEIESSFSPRPSFERSFLRRGGSGDDDATAAADDDDEADGLVTGLDTTLGPKAEYDERSSTDPCGIYTADASVEYSERRRKTLLLPAGCCDVAERDGDDDVGLVDELLGEAPARAKTLFEDDGESAGCRSRRRCGGGGLSVSRGGTDRWRMW